MEQSVKSRILFVDDEERVLNGLRRTLRGKIPLWEMEFAIGGPEALNILKQREFDVIVSDMRMPDMSGLELFQIIQEKYPQMIRIILSGHSDQEYLLRSTASTHQFLSKPCEIEVLDSAITRSTKLKRLLRNPQLVRSATQLKSIPSLPTVYREIQQALQKETVSLNEIGGIVEKDPGMSTKILQLVNSSFFGIAKHVSSPAQAVSLLGIEITRSLVLSLHLFDQIRGGSALPGLINQIWNHSTTVAKMAKKIARQLNFDPYDIDYAFMAGLLHDIGQAIFATEAPRVYMDLVDRTRQEDQYLWKLEAETFRTTHAEIGAYLMGLWGLKDTIIEAIAFHHAPSASGQTTRTALCALYIADVLDAELEPEQMIGRPTQFDMEYLARLGLEKQIDAIRKNILSR
jgi:putative nucleotidyltransferase with HDIG domain